MDKKIKLIRVTTVPISLKVLLRHQLKYMSNYMEVIGISSPGIELKEVEDQEGIRTIPVPMTRAITPFQDLKSIWNLYKILRKERPAIIHSHTPKAGLVAMIAGRLAGVPVCIHTVAGLPLVEATGVKRRLLIMVEKLIYRFAHKVYPNSSNQAQFIIETKLAKPSKIKVLGNGSSNGINTDFFARTPELESKANEIKSKHHLSKDTFTFVFVGRIVRDKGIHELIDSFVQIYSVNGSVRLLLVGPFEQSLDPISEDRLEILKTHPGIIHYDFQQDVRPFLMAADVLVFPSYREGFPNVPMQAGALALPQIVTNINGCNEIVEDGKNGLIVTPKSNHNLQAAMERMITNKSLFEFCKENARNMIVSRYHQPYFWNIIHQEYNHLLNKTQRV